MKNSIQSTSQQMSELNSDSVAAFFHYENGSYFGSDSSRGPWDENACHGGPVCAVIARELELLISQKQLVRLSVELLRMIPLDGFTIETEISRQGRAVSYASARVIDLKGNTIAIAHSLHMIVQSLPSVPSATYKVPDFSTANSYPLSEAPLRHDLKGFRDSIDNKYPEGQNNLPGPTIAWMKSPAIVKGETPSPFQKLCPMADSTSGISRNAESHEMRFVNPDITIVMFRASEEDWIGSDAKSYWEPTGIGCADSTLFDSQGAIGKVSQTLFIQQN